MVCQTRYILEWLDCRLDITVGMSVVRLSQVSPLWAACSVGMVGSLQDALMACNTHTRSHLKRIRESEMSRALTH